MNNVRMDRDIEEQEEKATNLFSKVAQSKEYTYYLDEPIRDASLYRGLSEVLSGANEGDVVNIMINSPGGYIDTAAQLSNLIQTSKAHVIGHLVGPSASAACTLFLSCHSWVVYPFSTLMAHTFRGGFYGKGNEARDSFESTSKFVEDMMVELYYPFFTEEEIEDMVKNNRDIYLNHKDIGERLKTLEKFRYPEQ
ncbi:putative ATP-dependent Clp protease [Pectobacterium phage DU_PP_V]|uniref:Putative ATP-dependent Clp protease n=1 Tax=Pectobacterium phage DU_PP_V TaxID=2041492 RepID=A0A2D2W726_9CAUD|nr:ATP-dependent protease [Pectobacterium phage DU_PP_V]ATS94014.1 putative ATP-dependent Clp protease [Pectobacterium phage DU_PP_V]